VTKSNLNSRLLTFGSSKHFLM